MRDKTKFKIWKWKIQKLGKYKFNIIKNVFFIENKLNDKKNNIAKVIGEIIKTILKFIFTIIILLCFFYIERNLYNYYSGYFEGIIKLSESHIFDFLIATLGIAGFLVALFYANLSSVLSSKYTNLDLNISNEVINEKKNKKKIKSITNYIITNIALIFFMILGFNFKIFIVSFFILYTIKIIIDFVDLSKEIFKFNDLNFISVSKCNQILDNIKKVQIKNERYQEPEFQISYYYNTKSKIQDLYKLLETFIKEHNYNAILNFEKIIIDLLIEYMKNKDKIPYYSQWFEEKNIHKSMLTMGDMELVTYINTGTIPQPERVKNKNWIEEEIFNLIKIGLEYLIKEQKLVYSYDILERLDRKIEQGLKYGNFKKIMHEEIMLCDSINNIIKQEKCDDVFYAQANIEIEELLFMGIILESSKYIIECKNFIDKLDYKKIKYKNIINTGLKIFNNEKLYNILQQLEFEKDIEGKIITDERYIKEHLYALLYNEINIASNLYKDILHYIEKSAKEMYESKKFYQAKMIVAKNIEIYNKMEYNFQNIKQIEKEIIQLKMDFIWRDNLPKDFEKTIKEFKIKNILLGIKLLQESNYNQKDNAESEFDIFGLILYNTYLLANNLILEEDIDSLKKIHGYLLYLSNICDIKVKKQIESNGFDEKFIIGQCIKPYMYFMDLEGKLIYLSRIYKDKRWEELVSKQFEKIKDIDLLEMFVEYGNINKKTVIISDMIRGSFDTAFSNKIMSDDRVKIEKDFYGEKIISDDEIVNKFKLDNYDFSEIYLCYYVNNKTKNKFMGKYNWNKKEQEDE